MEHRWPGVRWPLLSCRNRSRFVAGRTLVLHTGLSPEWTSTLQSMRDSLGASARCAIEGTCIHEIILVERPWRLSSHVETQEALLLRTRLAPRVDHVHQLLRVDVECRKTSTLCLYHRINDLLCCTPVVITRSHSTRHCNCNAVKKLQQNPVDPDARLDFHWSLSCENVQTSEKDDDEITFEVVDRESVAHVRGTGFLGSSCQPGRRDRVHNNIGGLPLATVTSHTKISLPSTIRIMFSAIQMSRKHHTGSGRHDLILTEPLSHAINSESSGASNKSKEWQTSGSVPKKNRLSQNTRHTTTQVLMLW